MNRRIAATAAMGVVALATVGLTGPAATADEAPPLHGHVMLIGAEFTGSGPSTVITGFRRCITLAAGQELPLHAHHANVHRGRAGEALAEAGNLVVPLAPYSPFTGCESFGG